MLFGVELFDFNRVLVIEQDCVEIVSILLEFDVVVLILSLVLLLTKSRNGLVVANLLLLGDSTGESLLQQLLTKVAAEELCSDMLIGDLFLERKLDEREGG